jgi:WD40 repeat protein
MSKRIILLFVLITGIAYSQLTLEIKSVNEGNIDMSEFPLMRADIKGFQNGNPVQIDLKNLLIMEYGYTIEPISIENNGEWQSIKWFTKRTDFEDNEVFYTSRLYWSLNNELTFYNMAARFSEYPIFRVYEDNKTITEISYGNLTPGDTIPYVLKINAFRKKPYELIEYPVFLDSITTDTEFFKIEWMGSDGDTDWSPPPRELRVDSKYWIKIIFTPQENVPYRDKLVFHYEDGFRKVIPLKGNSLQLPFESALKILEPNGGEIFTPCEKVKIKWEGQSPTNPVIISYSSNNGSTWNEFASVNDASEYEWTVPATITDRALLKVSQKFDKAKEFKLSNDLYPLTNANYSVDGNKVVTISNRGKITEWDLLSGGSPTVLTDIQLNPDYEEARYESFGISYIDEDEFFVHYRIVSEPSYMQKDTIVWLKTAENEINKKTTIGNNFRIGKIISDYEYNYSFAMPALGTQILLFSTKTGKEISTLNFNYPVRDISISKENQLAVLLMNNEIRYIDINDNFSFYNSAKYPDLRWIEKAEISPNGLFTAISEYQVNSGWDFSTYLVDNDTKILARQFTPAASEVVGLGFNSTSNILAIGSRNQPQVKLYDMTTADSEETLPPHQSELHKMILSPTGKSILTLASATSDNIYYRTFTYPEHDETDVTFRIVKPILSDELISIDADYLGHETEHTIISIRNEGEKFIAVSDVNMMFGVNFKVIEMDKDTILPGDNITLTVAFKPIETGIINDTLLFSSCIYTLKVPIQSEGYPRNITYYNEPYDFGQVCVGETKESEVFQILRNDDPVPLIINNLRFTEGQSPFTMNYTRDTVIPPNGLYYLQVKFTPPEIGNFERKIEVFYADQQILTDTFRVRGEGIGASLQYSHNRLLFIPEIPDREFSIKNTGDVDVTVLNSFTEPEGFFVINETFPFVLEPGDSAFISVTQIQATDDFVDLIIDADPCLDNNGILLGKYKGASYLSIPEVTVKPTEDAEIPISFKNTDNGDYNGIRKFEGEFSIYYKLFFPTKINSVFGDAEIYKNEVIGNDRIIGIRVEGDFPDEGVVAVLTGKPGLTDILEDDIVILDKNDIWGSSIINSYQNGKLIIYDEHITRVIKETQMIQIGSVAPNPANEIFTVKFTSVKDTFGKIEIINGAGQIVLKTNEIQISKGLNEISLNINMLPAGNYKLFIISDGEFSQETIIISR